MHRQSLHRRGACGRFWIRRVSSTGSCAQVFVQGSGEGKVFDHKHFKILGQHTQDILREYESWVVPSRDLFLKVDSNGPAEGGGIHLHLQFWQGEQVLVKSDAVLRAGSPLFIGGPKWRDGQLVFVLALQAGH